MVNIINYSEFSNRRKSRWFNNGFRTLFESVIPNEVIQALRDWKDSYSNNNYVMIGGLAMSYYGRPRYTEDIDLIFLSYEDIPDSVYKFRKNRKHGFEHLKTGVEVETIQPETINKDKTFFDRIFNDSIESDGIKIASPVSLIALKLGRFIERDRSDIIELYRYCIENNIDIDLSKYDLSEKELKNYNDLDKSISIHENKHMLEVNSLMKGNKYIFKYKEYDIAIFEANWGEPRFYFSNDIKRRINSINDFKFGISLTKSFENDNIRIVESSNNYNRFVKYFSKQESDIRSFLTNENIEMLKDIWNNLNPNRKLKS